MYSYAFLILLLPLLSFLVLGLAGMKMKKQVAGVIGTIVLGCVFAMSYIPPTSISSLTEEMPSLAPTTPLPCSIIAG